MPELEQNPYKCPLVPDFFIDPVDEGIGDQGAIVRVSLDCPRKSGLRFAKELRQVQSSEEIETAIIELRSAIAREIDNRCSALGAAIAAGKLAEFEPPAGLV